MTDKDTVQKDGQEVPTPRTGLRASNTVATLTPREVLPLQGRGLPPIDFEEPVWKTDYEYSLRIEGGPRPDLPPTQGRGTPPAGNVLPVDWPTAEETMGFQEVERAYEVLQLPLTDRVLWLEEQVSGLLDRIAIYNTKSSHKL